jgi:hypothetical protein
VVIPGTPARSIAGSMKKTEPKSTNDVRENHDAPEAFSGAGVSSGQTGAQTSGTEGIEKGVEGMSVGGAPGRHSLEEPPAIPTAPGAPAGDVVFDHPPSKAELKEAEAVMHK